MRCTPHSHLARIFEEAPKSASPAEEQGPPSTDARQEPDGNPDPTSTPATATGRKLQIIPAGSIYTSQPDPRWFGNPPNAPTPAWSEANWLKSRMHFSFAEYSDPHNEGFGVLRVLNDDLVQPHRGFGTHPHRNMELVTYVVRGRLTHRDDVGTEGGQASLGPGGLQYMTAGTGVYHSEHNLSEGEPLRFIQIWMLPRTMGLEPRYGETQTTAASQRNQWAHLVGDIEGGSGAAATINQDAHVMACVLDAGAELPMPLAQGRQAYLLCVEGAIQLRGEGGAAPMAMHDAAKLWGPSELTIRATTEAHCLVVEMKLQ